MSKKSKGNSNMLLIAGLGVGAFMLFANKSNANGAATGGEMPSGTGSDIPDAPKILAVNSTDTESPTPTGIVSDEEGMEATADNDNDSGGSSIISMAANAGAEVIKQVQEYNEIPPLVSTKLTPKEKDIIDKGKLTAALAVKRPDLYKAAYIKRYGGKTQAGKRAALIKASSAIDTAVNAAQAANNGGLKKAIRYPAKPEFTFVQSADGMAAQVAMSQMAAIQQAGVKVSPAAHKVSAQVKAAKSIKGKKPVKHTSSKIAKPAKKRPAAHATTAKKTIHKPAKKRVTKKHH